ncbi:MAG: Imm49 family immunity protein [Myxococcota bacterium]
MPELSEAYVIGLVSDLSRELPELERQMTQAKVRALAVDAELRQLLQRLEDGKRALEQAQADVARLTTQLSERNLRIATLHQEMAGLRKRSDDLKAEMERVGPGAISRRLRRDRAKMLVQIEDREGEVTSLREAAESDRQALHANELSLTAEKDRSRTIVRELDRLQAQLPDPALFIRLFETQVGLGHGAYFVERDARAWRTTVGQAIDRIAELHAELRAGKYRLDRNSDIVGGRAQATGEAMCAAVVLGDRHRATTLFQLATDPSLYFHQIFNVFRVWAFGLYLEGRTQELRELLRAHQYEPGLRGAYVEAFVALLGADVVGLGRALRNVARLEWDSWQDPQRVRGAGVVSLGGLALATLASERRMTLTLEVPTIPRALVVA